MTVQPLFDTLSVGRGPALYRSKNMCHLKSFDPKISFAEF